MSLNILYSELTTELIELRAIGSGTRDLTIPPRCLPRFKVLQGVTGHQSWHDVDP